MTDKILTLHPEGKQGVNIDLGKYKMIKETILDIINTEGEITYQNLNTITITRLKGIFHGSIPWYVVTVKLDLEARGIIERIPKGRTHIVRIKNQ
jgi:hypothetical protein